MSKQNIGSMLTRDEVKYVFDNQLFIYRLLVTETFLGNTNIGGTVFPRADTAVNTVTLVPRSPEVIAPTFRLPLAATILFGFSTLLSHLLLSHLHSKCLLQ